MENILHDIHLYFPLITSCVFYAPETVHLQLEEIRKDIQDATSNFFFNINTPNTHILGTADETINYTKWLLQSHQYYYRKR